MASLANLPKLRRTLTDVMEDELYHIPGQSLSNNASSSPKIQHAFLTPNNPASNSSINLNRFNNSSQEMLLNIPDSFTETHNEIMNNPALMEDNDEDDDDLLMGEDDDEVGVSSVDKLYSPEIFNIQPFHDYANPNVFNSYNNQLHPSTMLHQDPFQQSFELPLTVSPRDAHIKLPEELLLAGADPSNPLFNPIYDSTQQLFVWPNDSSNKNQLVGPEQLYLDEISDDDEDDDLMDADLNNYYDVNDSPPTSPSNLQNLQKMHDQAEENITNTNDGNDENNGVDDVLDDAGVMDEFIASGEDGTEVKEDEFFTVDPNIDASIASSVLPTGRKKQESLSPPSGRGTNTKRKQFGLNSSITPDGLHICHMINPNSHKPCEKQFSRPYDLVRHQETIHASKKKIYRCTLCEEDYYKSGNARLSNKTFSRGDALSRHIRVKHGLTGNEANELIRIAKENVEYVDVMA